MKRDGHGHKDDERARWAADLELAAAKKRDDEPADDRGVQATVRGQSGGDGDRHGERQRHDGYGQPGESIGAEICEPLALPEYRDQLRCK